jgi:flagellar hook-associated protein 3 FlgL
LSSVRDLDFAEAISRLNQQMTGLQAAQAAYTRIGQMSLFDAGPAKA